MNKKQRKLIAVIACVFVILMALAACAPATQLTGRVPFVAQMPLFQ